jgi:hypothetical protein
MNTAYLLAFAASTGSTIGGLESFASAGLTQHHKDRQAAVGDDGTAVVDAVCADINGRAEDVID